MYNYKLTNKAVEDLSNIWNYTFDFWSENQADFYYKMLVEKFIAISKKQELGRNYKGIEKNLYGLNIGRHIIFYRIIDDFNIEITRILHERMDLKNRILE